MIKYYHREKQRVEEEKIYGDWFIKLVYKNTLGKYIGPLFTNSAFSDLYGKFQDLKLASLKVPGFVEDFDIDLNEYEPGSVQNAESQAESYAHFNEFFVRKFRSGKRSFVQGKQMPAFSEARYFGGEALGPEVHFPVKGKYLRAKDLLQNEEWAKVFEGGPYLVARLCPVDYHRYHYPDNGKLLAEYRLHGEFHSVNPMALQLKQDILITNERHINILETENFGKLAYIEVGAVCVGKIVQTHPIETDFKRGEEKGLFLFGGSTVIVLGEPGKWKPSADIIEHTNRGMEVYLKLGDQVAKA